MSWGKRSQTKSFILLRARSETKPSVLKAAQAGLIDDIFMPAETRERLIRSFDLLRSKEEDRPLKKHGNMPL